MRQNRQFDKVDFVIDTGLFKNTPDPRFLNAADLVQGHIETGALAGKDAGVTAQYLVLFNHQNPFAAAGLNRSCS